MGKERLTAKSVKVLPTVLMGHKNIDAKSAKFPAHMLKSYINAKKVVMSHLLEED